MQKFESNSQIEFNQEESEGWVTGRIRVLCQHLPMAVQNVLIGLVSVTSGDVPSQAAVPKSQIVREGTVALAQKVDTKEIKRDELFTITEQYIKDGKDEAAAKKAVHDLLKKYKEDGGEIGAKLLDQMENVLGDDEAQARAINILAEAGERAKNGIARMISIEGFLNDDTKPTPRTKLIAAARAAHKKMGAPTPLQIQDICKHITHSNNIDRKPTVAFETLLPAIQGDEDCLCEATAGFYSTRENPKHLAKAKKELEIAKKAYPKFAKEVDILMDVLIQP